MIYKRVLLGSLVAGAMILPINVNAGVVGGACVNCHTMHNSQDGAVMGGATPNPQLLKAPGAGTGAICENCHAVGLNNAQGVDPAFFNAPQINDATAPNLAGWFTTTGGNEIMHNVSADLTGVSTDSILGNSAPGSGFGNDTCAGCHILVSGGHHGQNGTSYRMLFSTAGTSQIEDSTYGNAQTAGIVDVSATTYDSDEMNAVCNRCHGDFHGDAVTEQWDGSAWIRHPTDLRMADAQASNYDYSANYSANANANITPLGNSSSVILGTAGTQTLMCITCHFSHGSGENDLLRFAYNNGGVGVGDNVAGDSTRSPGCESCHDYSGTALLQNGM